MTDKEHLSYPRHKNINHEANIASMKSSIQSQQESAQNTNSDEIETLRKK